MQSRSALRLAVIGFCVLMAALVAVTISENDTLPEVLPETPVSPLVLLVGAAALVGLLVSCIAILAFKRWGVWLHLVSTGVGMCAAALIGPHVVSAASSVIDSLIMISTGFIYGLAFFTDALDCEEEMPNKSPEPTR